MEDREYISLSDVLSGRADHDSLIGKEGYFCSDTSEKPVYGRLTRIDIQDDEGTFCLGDTKTYFRYFSPGERISAVAPGELMEGFEKMNTKDREAFIEDLLSDAIFVDSWGGFHRITCAAVAGNGGITVYEGN